MIRAVFLVLLVLVAGLGVAWLFGAFDPGTGPDPTSDLTTPAGDGPTLSALGRPGDRVDGARLTAELKQLEGGALAEHLARYAQGDHLPAVGYDEGLARHLIELLRHEHAYVRVRARTLLGRLGPQAAPLVLPLLDDASAVWRRHGILVVQHWLPDGYVLPTDRWLRLLADPDKTAHRFAWQALCSGVAYDDALVEALVALVRDSPYAEVLGPERALAGMGPRGVGRLFDLLEERPEALDLNVLSALAWADPATLAAHVERLGPWIRAAHEDRQVHALRCVRGLADDALEKVLPDVIAAWAHESLTVRLELLLLLAANPFAASRAIDVLLDAMRNDDERIARYGFGTLGRLRARPETVLPYLRDQLDTTGDDVTAFSLGTYGEAASSYVRSALASPDDDVRYLALHAAYAMGPASRSVRDAVRPLVEVDDEELAKRAAIAMGMMGEEAAEALPAIWDLLMADKLTYEEIADILGRTGAAGRAFILARWREKATHVRAREVLYGWPGDTRFALGVLTPWLASEDRDDRYRALGILAQSLTSPPAPPTGWPETFRFAPQPGVIADLRRLVSPFLEDDDELVRGEARSILGRIAAIEADQKG